ncbi:penicillin-binding protein 2 [Mumia sp. zg.B53]|uniref:peptidoglycan D,D-transpeptidase FtsI family protein n=1 Tax=unclassified Mumia TaxID=2621872 RepID=UPI001C6F1C1C|nr:MULTISPECIES: penicillin-binding protein 2 [unclassified Mumia]MBW9211467.1 penicillin-binding protein 2 [Mumia sp. zg.B21]MBW9216640.1 penicillin-binding protein 2 [Mumia sp. zg.B53]
MSPAVRNRARFCFVVVATLLVIFAGRLFQIQGVDANAYAERALKETVQPTVLHADRGRILDRDGEPLATSLDAQSIIANPRFTAKPATEIASILAAELGVDYFDTVTKLRREGTQFVYVARKVPAYQASSAMAKLADAGLLNGVTTERDAVRTYPGGTLGATLIGLVSGETGEGTSGLEKAFDDDLTGSDGKATYETSPKGVRIPLARQTMKEAVPGADVVTTIDRDLQWYADKRLAAAVRASDSDWGVAITVDLETMQVLQLSQLPTFDAEDRSTVTPASMNNRAVQNVYEPGSVQKVVTMAALADAGLVTPQTKVRVPSELRLDGFTISDWWDHGRLRLTAAGVVAKSSNLGTIALAQQMDDATMHDYLTKFGFGRPTGVGLSSESRGILTPAERWSRAQHATISFGQGISVTAMQQTAAVAAIANGGRYTSPTLVTEVRRADGTTVPRKAPEAREVVSPEAASMVTTMMEAVTSPRGSAPNVSIPGYRVAGKTGTAWRVNPDTGRYVRGENTVSFIGFAPAEKPRFLTYVVLDNPQGGGSGSGTAGPVFRDIMQQSLQRYGIAPSGSRAPRTPVKW